MNPRLCVLGPVRAYLGDRPVPLGPRQERLVLAVLALEAGRSVPADRLVDLLWPDGTAPRSARASVQVRVSGLRNRLGTDLIRSVGSGYYLAVDPQQVDAHRFRHDTARAHDLTDPADRSAALREALELWQGRALHDVGTDELRARLTAGLEEARLVALEDRVDADLDAGRELELVDELTGLTRAHPDRERLTRALMVALDRAGQTDHALALASDYRDRLVVEQGLDPSAEFGELERSLRSADRRPATCIPPPLGEVAGRERELLELDRLVSARPTAAADDGAEEPDHARLALLTGPAGAGKTTLAVRWAHSVKDRFPDGTLYVDLRDRTGVDALGELLGALGAAGVDDPPRDLNEASATYRSLLTGRRALILLDDAADAEQVRPLLPGHPGCLTLVTSRHRLSGLVATDGAVRVRLDAAR